MDFTPYDILSCVATDDTRPGCFFQTQHVVCRLPINPEYANELLEALVSQGYLIKEKGGTGKISGWRFTEAGVALLK